MDKLKWQEFMPIIFISKDGRAAISTTKVLYDAARFLNREPAVITVKQNGLVQARTKALEIVKELWEPGARGFFIDDDIECEGNAGNTIADYVRRADEENCSFTGAYLTTMSTASIQVKPGVNISPEEYPHIDNWATVNRAGLGFYYGDLPQGYDFKYEHNEMGEDYRFFADNPEIVLKLAKSITLNHIKTIPLSLLTP